MRAVVTRLKTDHPKATIVAMTIIPFLNLETSRQINDLITRVAAEEGLPLFDISLSTALVGRHRMNV